MSKIKELARLEAGEKAKMSTQAEETLSNIRTVKSFSNEDNEITKFEKVNDQVYVIGKQKVNWDAAFFFIS
jgi:ABC-type multidrug transport system fused ATPase/permease subunit